MVLGRSRKSRCFVCVWMMRVIATVLVFLLNGTLVVKLVHEPFVNRRMRHVTRMGGLSDLLHELL